MEANCFNEMCHDVFGCAECDYKSGTETVIKDEIHIKSECDSIEVKSECDSIEVLFLPQAEGPQVKSSQDAYGVSTTMHGTDHEIIKQELDPLDLETMEFRENFLRLENKAPVKRKATNIPGFVLENDNGKYKLVKITPGRRITKIPGVVIGVNNAGKYIPEGWQRKIYRITEGDTEGYHRAVYISPTGDILSGRKQVSNYLMNHDSKSPVDINQFDFTTASQIQKIDAGKAVKVEIEVDNTDIYIPDGWERKAFEYLNDSKIKRLAYISPFNKEIFNYSQMRQYLQQLESFGHSLSVDIERLNFSLKSLNLEKKEPGISIEIDNTGKYIPDGWQRKVYQITDDESKKGKHRVYYISATGHRLHNKSNVIKHIDFLEQQGIINTVDIEQIDFSTELNAPPLVYEKVEVEVNNTNAYIPEGWERKAYKFTETGRQQVYYLSPYNRLVGSRSGMAQYLAKMKKEGCSLSVKKALLSFSKNDIV